MERKYEYIDNQNTVRSTIILYHADINRSIINSEQRISNYITGIISTSFNAVNFMNSYIEESFKLILGYGFDKTLKRGFSIVCDENKKLISSVKQVKYNQQISMTFYDGEISAYITELNDEN